MPWKTTMKRARKDRAEGKAPSTQAGEFVHEEMEHIKRGKHGARNARQAIAIGLNKARRAGVNLKPPKQGRTSAKTRKSAESAYRAGRSGRKTSRRRSRAVEGALKREGHSAASRKNLSRQATSAARRRSAASRSAAAKKAARTKGPRERSLAAKKAARTRQQERRAA